MTMYPPSEQTAGEQEPFTPSAEQLVRERALKRYNRKFIYVPILITVAIVLLIIILMLVAVFAPGPAGSVEFRSGLADTRLGLWMIPMMVFSASVPIRYLGYVVNRRQRRAQLPPDSPLLRHRRAQMAMWQAQDISNRIEKKTDSVSDRIANPFIALGRFSAYVYAWLTILTRPFRRDDYYDPDGSNDPDGND
mgnify:CR=1 FL=1